MKKLSLIITLVSFMALTGCLKDKEFENYRTGMVLTEVKGVAFPQAASSPITVGITGQAAPLVVTGPFLTLEADRPATSDVHIKLAFDDALVTAKGLTPLPAGSYSVNTLDITIPAGKSFYDQLKVTVNNTNTLDPNIKYGIGFKIVSVDGGYIIANNSRNVVLGFAIKNKYDGIYTLKGHHNRAPYTFPYETTIHMVTNGPNEVYFYWPEPGVNSTGHPIGVSAGGMSWYGNAISPSIIFNPATDLATNIYNFVPGTPISMQTTNPVGGDNNVAVGETLVSRFVPGATPTQNKIYAYWRYNANDQRAFFDTLTYVGPRP